MKCILFHLYVFYFCDILFDSDIPILTSTYLERFAIFYLILILSNILVGICK